MDPIFPPRPLFLPGTGFLYDFYLKPSSASHSPGAAAFLATDGRLTPARLETGFERQASFGLIPFFTAIARFGFRRSFPNPAPLTPHPSPLFPLFFSGYWVAILA